MDRQFTVYQREPEDRKGLPRWCFFFLVDIEHQDVFVPARMLSEFEFLTYLTCGEACIYPGDVKQIHNRPFVSARALARDDARWETFRMEMLERFRKCPETVESFD